MKIACQKYLVGHRFTTLATMSIRLTANYYLVYALQINTIKIECAYLNPYFKYKRNF